MNHMHLVGAEDVRAAASQMQRAAAEIAAAASQIESAFEQQRRFLDDWLQRFGEGLTVHGGVMEAHGKMLLEDALERFRKGP